MQKFGFRTVNATVTLTTGTSTSHTTEDGTDEERFMILLLASGWATLQAFKQAFNLMGCQENHKAA